MLTKERYKKALGELSFALDNFNILDKPSLWECVSSGAVGFEKLIKEHFNPQPYKFEDLETDMQVYDNCLKECIVIGVIRGENMSNNTVPFYRWAQEELEVVEYKENRFYPVQMANREAEEHERNSVHDL